MNRKMPMTVGAVRPVMAAQPQTPGRMIAPVPGQSIVKPPMVAQPAARVAAPSPMALSQSARLAETLKRMSKG